MMPLVNRYQQLVAALVEHRSSAEQFRFGVFWGVIVISAVILGLTSFHIQSIPKRIQTEVDNILVKRPWIQELVVVDGRDVLLRGQIEPDSGIDYEIDLINSIAGVGNVTNMLEETPKPEPYFRLLYSERTNALNLTGQLDGATLENLLNLIEDVYQDSEITDRITIDDRVGRPMWLEGIGQSLSHLEPLAEYELNGWRNHIELSGLAQTQSSGRQISYAFPASLIPEINLTTRITEQGPEQLPQLLLISDWRGVYLAGMVSNEQIRQELILAISQTFGVDQAEPGLVVSKLIQSDTSLRQIAQLIPVLGEVRNLRIESSNDGFILWGRVDNPAQLGVILLQRNRLGLEQQVRNQIQVAEATRQASLSLFSDGVRAVIDGILPTQKSKRELVQSIKEYLGVTEVVDLVSIQPDIAHSRWIFNWETLIRELPDTAVGVTIDGQNILITGNTQSDQEIEQMEQHLKLLFPNINHLNWMTAKTL